MKGRINAGFELLLKPCFLLRLLLLNFKIGNGQTKVEKELFYNNGKSLYMFNKDGKFGIGRDSAHVELSYDSNYTLALVYL